MAKVLIFIDFFRLGEFIVVHDANMPEISKS